MADVYALILAGGKGMRMGDERPKQFLPLQGKPILIRTLESFARLGEITGLILALPADYIAEAAALLERFSPGRDVSLIAGGATRQESAYRALTCREFAEEDILLIHDAARPLVTERMILDCIRAAAEAGAAGVYVRAIDTIAEGGKGFVLSIPERGSLYYTQTPQGFRCSVIRDAHERALARGEKNATDDVSLVLEAGYSVKMTEGDYRNIKITTPLDLELAELLIRKVKTEERG